MKIRRFIPLFLLLPLSAPACITPPAVPFANVAPSSFTVTWNTSCSTGTVYFAQASRQATFSSPIAPAGAANPAGTLFAGLNAGTLYFVRVSTNASMAAPLVLGSTVTALVPAGSPQTAASGSAEVTVPPDAFLVDYALLLSADPEDDPVGPDNLSPALEEAGGKTAANTGDPRRRPLPGSLVEVRCKDATGAYLQPRKPLRIELSYAKSGGYVQGLSPLVRPDTLSIYGLDEAARQWVRLPSTHHPSARTVTASSGGYAVFALMGRTDTSLTGVYAYPQPFTPGPGAALTFAEVSQDAVVRLYTSAGVLLRTLREEDGDGRLAWDGREDGGNVVAAGVYYYVIESASEKRRGKLMVIR